ALTLALKHRADLPALPSAQVAFLAQSARARTRRRGALAATALAVLGAVAALAWAAFLRPGRLSLASDPPAATVRAGERTLGLTPLAIDLAPGVHALTLAHPAHEDLPLTL